MIPKWYIVSHEQYNFRRWSSSMTHISIQVQLKPKSHHIVFRIIFTHELCNLIKMTQYTWWVPRSLITTNFNFHRGHSRDSVLKWSLNIMSWHRYGHEFHWNFKVKWNALSNLSSETKLTYWHSLLMCF